MKLKEKNRTYTINCLKNTDDQSPSNMYNKLIETENAEINKTKVDFIKKILSKLQKTLIMCRNITY